MQVRAVFGSDAGAERRLQRVLRHSMRDTHDAVLGVYREYGGLFSMG